MKAMKNFKEMEEQYRRTTDPDEREFIRDAARDYVRQELYGKK